MMALPNPAETRKAIDNLDLLVVIDTIPSEIAGYADVVLPEVTFLERYDELLTGWGRRGWMSLRQPVMPPPQDQKPGWWIAKGLAAKLGIAGCMPFDDIEDYLRYRVEKTGLDWNVLKRDGVIMADPVPIYAADGAALEFDTPSGKIEFWSDQLAARGFDPVPTYTPPAKAPDGYFALITGRAPVHSFSRTQTNPYLSDLMSENEVWVNAAVAADAGLKSGAVRATEEPGRCRQQPRPGQGHAAHPRRLRLHGLRLRPHQQDAQGRLSQGRQRRGAHDEVRDRPADGRHQHPQQLRDLREGGLTCPASEWSSTPASASAAWTAWSPARRRTTCPHGYCRDWITTEARGEFPQLTLEIRSERCNHCDNPPCVSCCPTGASHVEDPGKVVLVTAEQVHRLQGLHLVLPLRRALRPSRRATPTSARSATTARRTAAMPACVAVCPTHCMHFGDLDDPESRVAELLRTRPHHTLLPEAGTGPRVFYLT